MGRRVIIGGNWKSNGTLGSVKELMEGLNKAEVASETVEAVVAPTALHLDRAVQTLDKSKYAIAAQNCNDASYGAYTGELAPEAVEDVGCKWVILGHSERRQIYNESNAFLQRKLEHVLKSTSLSVMFCIGETLEQRKANDTFNVLFAQLDSLKTLAKEHWNRIVIAYEPVWAIGTGETASSEQAQEAHAGLRKWVVDNIGSETAAALRIIYGGSVKPANCISLIQLPDVDGFLVGGASLKAADFGSILNAPRAAGQGK